jgi:hypothetical protein
VEVELAGDVVRLEAMLSLDLGPMREFRPFLTIDLDEAHATELLGKLALALDQRRILRGWDAAMEVPGNA